MKTYLFVALFVVAACTGDDRHSQNMEKAQKMFDAFNRHDWKRMSSCYSERASFLDPSYGKAFVPKSREETSAKYAEMEKMFPDIHDAITAMYPSGDKVIVEFVSTGKSGDSISFTLPIISVLTFSNGEIVKDATYYDQ